MNNIKPYLFLVFLMLLTSCNLVQQDIKYRIGMSQCSDGDWRHKMNDEMYREILFYPEADLEMRIAHDDVETQINDIRYYIDKKIDLLIVSPLDAEKLTPVISEAYQAGIPVVVVDRLVKGDQYTASVTGDNVGIGKEISDFIVNRFPQGCKVVEIQGMAGSSPVAFRHKGLVDGLGSRVGYDIVASIDGGWRADSISKRLSEIESLLADVDVVVAHNDAMAMDAKQVIDNMLPGNDIIYVGVDALPGKGQGCESIVNGMLTASAAYPTAGDVAIRTAMNILTGKEYDRDVILPTYMVGNPEEASMLNKLYSEMQHETQTVFLLQRYVDNYWRQLNQERAFLIATMSCIVLLLLLLIFIVRSYLYKHRTNRRLEQQREELRQQRNQLLELTNDLKAATHAKLNFFTNVSHDFRTPLTLIAGPVEQLSKDQSLNSEQHNLVGMAMRNAKILLNLINQTLDLRKYESGKLELKLEKFNIRESIETWASAFNEIAERKNINLRIECQDADYVSYFDPLKAERVFYNLLGNAFKFTPVGGEITLSLVRQGDNFIFKIGDTGPGVPTEHIQQIFDNFYQAGATSSEGSGIGLALVKSFVELHGGTISVSSREEGTGAVFTIVQPVKHDAEVVVESVDTTDSAATTASHTNNYSPIMPAQAVEQYDEPIEISEDETRPVALIIDDNPDILTYLHSLLSDKYVVLLAQDGETGLNKAMRMIPDVIICDIMMPDMDGMECCRRLKSGMHTCHIPIMMLTASAVDEKRIESHKEGADAFLSKPFSPEVLVSQIDALIESHDRVMKYFSNGPLRSSDMNAKERHTGPVVSIVDEKFMERVQEVIEANLGDCEFSVDNLSAELKLSRSQLFRKVKALVKLSPLDLIRQTRLLKARDMLQTSGNSVKEVCYLVGFTSPSYFAKCYKEFFNEMPGDVIKKSGN